ncbi:helix-turn-helix transcriptional regulator [Curtobacterium sp. NPDC090217]|uniref:helix-turn-helix transcriptional regulator n=1 Tax=Curtobacterium sp. NPDC090217 TaxID=3363970 RepID=UPI00381AFB4D
MLPEPSRPGGPAGPPLDQRPPAGRSNPLGEYLRARRELVTPEVAGISVIGVRRVPGLRREEVAMLAGISADYYLRLEKGRDRNPSVQVLDSLARVLRLDDDHRAHLLGLGGGDPAHRRPRQGATEVPDSVRKLLDSIDQPAFIEDRHFDVVASNEWARALSTGFDVGGNQLLALFEDPSEQAMYPDWESVTECFVGSLRQVIGNDGDRRFEELITALAGNPRFRELWARHEVQGQSSGTVRIVHPHVGPLTLNRDRLEVSGTDGLALVVHHADAGSVDAERLRALLP